MLKHMKLSLKNYHRLVAISLFIVLPMLFYVLGDFPRRTWLKELFSIISILAFFMMLLQFFLSRGNKKMLSDHKMSRVIKWHKVLGYTFVGILLVHPILMILPRYYDPGIDFGDAFRIMLNQWATPGIRWGIIAWCLMLLIGITSLLRQHIGLKYKSWRILHGLLSIAFIILADIHVISLGRHIDLAMRILILTLSSLGVLLMLKLYLFNNKIAVKQ